MAGRNAAFKLAMGAWANGTVDKLDGLARVSIQDLCEGVVDDTPVDTGFLVGNWQPSVGVPAVTFTVGKPPGEHGGAANAGQALAEMAGVIPGIKTGDIFYMMNNANYALFLERGTVHMAGRFFVERNTKKWQLYVNTAAVKLGLAK